ncbi:MAG: type II toxin-antitoxin system HicB family antitoxin [Pseudomonadota bacterium]
MKDYHINIFYSEEDEGYIADIPDLDHCSAFGETAEEALAEVLKAKNAWLESAMSNAKPVPQPYYRPVIYQVA